MPNTNITSPLLHLLLHSIGAMIAQVLVTGSKTSEVFNLSLPLYPPNAYNLLLCTATPTLLLIIVIDFEVSHSSEDERKMSPSLRS